MKDAANKTISKLPDFQDLGEQLKTATGEDLEKAYVRDNRYIAVIGYKVLKDFARFTSHEDLTIDAIDYAGKSRLYLTGLKRRAVMRRSSEAILREFNPAYGCATPDHQCMTCYNCYAYGGVIAIKNKTKALRARMKPTTSFSIQNEYEAIIDEPEFHTMTHADLSMAQTEEQKKASIYEMVLIKPGTVFPFIDLIFSPTHFDLAMYLETVNRADAQGYGSRSSLLGTMETEIIAVTSALNVTQKELLASIQINDDGGIDDSKIRTLLAADAVAPSDLELMRLSLPDLVEKYRDKIYTRE
jgi:CRISPR type I-D-associated protein Csc2